jgi:hypothetical protein
MGRMRRMGGWDYGSRASADVSVVSNSSVASSPFRLVVSHVPHISIRLIRPIGPIFDPSQAAVIVRRPRDDDRPLARSP